VDDVDDDDEDVGLSDFAAAPEYTVTVLDESLLLTNDLECRFVLPFKTNSLQSAFVTLEVDAFDDRGIEAAVLLFILFSTFPNLCAFDPLPFSINLFHKPLSGPSLGFSFLLCESCR
jgi:hypothetical protein